MAGQDESAVRHFAKVLLVLAIIVVVYSLGLAGVYRVGPDTLVSTLAPRATSLKSCLTEGWQTAPYQPLFWLATGIVFMLYNAVTGEIDPES